MTIVAGGRGRGGDACIALMIALLLTFAWALHDWHRLSSLDLPDTDDVMRLQQIRDWISGQRFADVSQHRLGASPGLGMHWSRLPDIVPGALIVGLTPAIGRRAAEIAAVIAWPAMLLFAALFVTARIARVAGGGESARTAAIVAAIAFPSSTIFLPGRIDHHGLQVVLLLVLMHALIARTGSTRGLVAGVATVASITIGLETLPLIAAAGVVILAEWVDRRSNDGLMGFGIALVVGLAAAHATLRTEQFAYPACDGFTAIAWRVAQLAAFLPILLACAGYVTSRRDVRGALAALAVGLFGVGVLQAAPMCLTPYGNVDPMLAKLWLANVAEAQPLLRARPEIGFGYAGLMVTGIAAGIWRWRVTKDEVWRTLLMVQLAALALSCLQLRGAYAGAILAAPALAAVVAAARRRGSFWLVAAWIGSAGTLYPLAGYAFIPRVTTARPATTTASCTAPEALARLLPLQGRLIAPLDLGAYALAASELHVVGAPYHRGNKGNAAVYSFFLGSSETARRVAMNWQVNYVALCDDSFAELGRGYMDDRKRLIGMLHDGRVPGWLHAVPAARGMRLFSIDSSR